MIEGGEFSRGQIPIKFWQKYENDYVFLTESKVRYGKYDKKIYKFPDQKMND